MDSALARHERALAFALADHCPRARVVAFELSPLAYCSGGPVSDPPRLLRSSLTLNMASIPPIRSVARGFQPLNEKQVKALLARTQKAAKDGAFEKYKTSGQFDGTAKNPQWLG